MSKHTAARQRSYRLFVATRLALASLAGVTVTGMAYAEDAVTLPTVTVTGEKIDRSQQDTTTAVSVFQTPKVDDGQNHDIVELQQEVPNTTRNAAGNINIRGVDGNGPVSGGVALMTGTRARISTTVDGVNETWAGQQYMNVGLWDVEQVEVLRGPQSTIQGRNAIGGAVVVNTKDPTFDWEGAVRAGYENEDGRGYLAGVISGPIVDKELAFRIAAEGTKGHGFIDYEGDYPWDPSELQNHAIRGKLLWTPSAVPELKAKLTLQNRKYEGEYLNRVEALCTTPDCTNEGDLKDYTFSSLNAYTRRQDSRSNNANIDVEYAFSEALTGHLLYSRGNDKLHFEQSDKWLFSMDQKQDSNTLEARMVYAPRDGRISGVAGLYYFDRDQDLLVGDTNPTYVTIEGTDKVKTYAGYGEATIGLSEHIDLIAGARIEREQQNRDLVAWGADLVTDVGETLFLPKVGVQYKLPQTTFGFTVRKGYNPGAGSLDWNTNEYYEYDKEEVIAYELSSRSLLLNNRVSFSATAFYNDYSGYQAFNGRRVVNIDKGVTYGLELDMAAQVSSSLNLYGSVGLLRSDVKDGGEGSAAFDGNDFNYAPSFTANVGFSQKFAGYWSVSGNVSYTGEYYSGIDNDEREKAGDYTLANLQLAYDKGNYAIRLYVKNLFDEEILYDKTVTTERWPGTRPVMEANVGAPRTFGIIADYRF
ncbi:TonB-dependent receptor [Chitiniphilus eburneus]|uniref:TonB-dependent receptor n=1 Tax=Chitiniphilus eburneus TaxID=2571148 RepID=UPI0035CF2A75